MESLIYLDLLPSELILILMKYLKGRSNQLSKLNDYYLKIYNEFTNNIKNGLYKLNEVFTIHKYIGNGNIYKDIIKSHKYYVIINNNFYNDQVKYDIILEKMLHALSSRNLNKCYLDIHAKTTKFEHEDLIQSTTQAQEYIKKEYNFLSN